MATDVTLRIAIDRTSSLAAARDVGHTRWHPDLAPIATIAPEDLVSIDTRDGGDGQITTTSSLESDVAFDLDRLHPLTGPFFIEGAEPSDVLEVEFVDVTTIGFGWTSVTPGGHGLVADLVHDPIIVKWDLVDGVATSPALPGVRIAGAPFVGVIGVAPSHERLQRIAAREQALTDAGGWALLPSSENAIPETAGSGLRTMPPREIGGNLDLKDVVAGSRVLLPVDVEGALLSIGDVHFAQGDGESYGTAIETAGTVLFRCRLHKSAELRWRPETVAVNAPPRVASDEGRYMLTTGIPVDERGANGDMDLRIATRQALEELVRYVTDQLGYTRSQAQAIVSVAGDLRICVINNPPNALVTAALPLDIFDPDTMSAAS